MAPKSPKRSARKVIVKRVTTPRSERARRREDERAADEEDDVEDEIEEEESADLPIRGVDGLSTEELRRFMDAMGIWSKLTPDARSALNSFPLQTVARADELTHEDQVTKIASLIDNFIEPCLDRETFDICLLYTSPSPRDAHESRMPSSA